VPSGNQWLHAGQLWITSGGAGAGGNTVAAELVIILHLIGLRLHTIDATKARVASSLLLIPDCLPHPKYLNQHFTPC
jgi:hypothetical protein